MALKNLGIGSDSERDQQSASGTYGVRRIVRYGRSVGGGMWFRNGDRFRDFGDR